MQAALEGRENENSAINEQPHVVTQVFEYLKIIEPFRLVRTLKFRESNH